MRHGLHPAWCDGCNGMSLVGGPVAVANVVGVDRRTIYSWCVTGQIHARPLRHRRWQVCACSACGVKHGDRGCERCRKIIGENWDKWDIKPLDPQTR